MKLEAVGKPKNCKLIRITCYLPEPIDANSELQKISIRGDFFAIPEEGFEELEEMLVGTKATDLARNFDEFARQLGLRTMGIDGAGVMEIVKGAIDAV